MQTSKLSVYQRVTSTILGQLEAGVIPWHQSWRTSSAGAMPLRHQGMPYRGINVMLLWIESMHKGYTSPHWLTYKQAQADGGNVKRGEHGTAVVFADKFCKSNVNPDNGEITTDWIPFLRTYSVFNEEQCDGLPVSKFPPLYKTDLQKHERDASLESFITRCNVDIRIGGNRACYVPALDLIHLPELGAFESASAYYSTALHELTHSTGHKSRLNRQGITEFDGFGSPQYAREELIAEMGSAYLCAALGVDNGNVRPDHASYLDGWIKILRTDSRAIIQAASKAQAAADYLQAMQRQAAAA